MEHAVNAFDLLAAVHPRYIIPLALEDGCGEWHHLRLDRIDTDEDGTSVAVLTVDDTVQETPIVVQPTR
jgi:hypothetical protein